MCLCFLDCIEHTGIPSTSVQPDNDSLMAAVSLLEANWISIQEIFELASRVLTQIFIGLWPKQRAGTDFVWLLFYSSCVSWAECCRALFSSL
jgi:hypothetical protein